MRLVIQRVDSASVKISNKIYNNIDKGYLIYVCFEKGDTGKNLDKVVSKIISLRIFEDSMGKMNKSILEVSNTSILLISHHSYIFLSCFLLLSLCPYILFSVLYISV